MNTDLDPFVEPAAEATRHCATDCPARSARMGTAARNALPVPPRGSRRALLATLACAAVWPATAATKDGAAAALPLPKRTPWPAGKPTPALELPDLEGRAWSLAARRGRVVVLNFWATWCGPCREELPSLEAMAERHRADGVEVATVNYQEGAATIRRFLEATPMRLPVLRDAEGDAARAFGVRVFPCTVFVGRDGQAAFSVVGAADWNADPVHDWLRAMR